MTFHDKVSLTKKEAFQERIAKVLNASMQVNEP